jgi:hypothetical protein
MNRLAWALVAVVIVVPIGGAVAYLEARHFGVVHYHAIITLGLAAAGGILWLADRTGLMAAPFSSSTHLGLSQKPSAGEGRPGSADE